MVQTKKKSGGETPASRVWLVTGSDEAEVKKAANSLATELAPGEDPFGVETIDGVAANVDDAGTKIGETLQALLTSSMFGGTKLVWLKNANFFADSVMGRSEYVVREVEKLLHVLKEGLPEGVRFLISAPEADKRRTPYKTLLKIAKTRVEDKPDFGWNATEADVVSWVEEKASAKGLQFEDEALEILAARVGADSRQLDSELEKLSMAGREGPINTTTVRELVPSTRAGGIFDLSNAITRRDLPGALAILDQLLRQRETPVGILLAAIVPTVRNLLLVSDLMQRHRLRPPAKAFYFGKTLESLPPEETAHLPRKKDGSLSAYPLGLAATVAGKFSTSHLQKCFLLCREANKKLVTSSLEPKVILGSLLIELLSPVSDSR